MHEEEGAPGVAHHHPPQVAQAIPAPTQASLVATTTSAEVCFKYFTKDIRSCPIMMNKQGVESRRTCGQCAGPAALPAR